MSTFFEPFPPGTSDKPGSVGKNSPVADPLIRAEDLEQKLGEPNLVVVDCRFDLQNPDAGLLAYEAGHIAHARYAHLELDLSGPVTPGQTGRHPLPNPEELAETLGSWGISAGTTVVAYDDASGALAARLWWLLAWLGHDRAQVLDGGFAAWQAIGGHVETDSATVVPTAFHAHERPALVALADEVLSASLSSSLSSSQGAAPALLDARATPRFRGDEEPIDRIPGHIPGARSLPFLSLLQDGHFAPPDRIRALFEGALGGPLTSEAICYCGSGVTACHLLLGAVHAGLPMPRLYAGSYSEWITDPARSVERGG